MVTSRVPTLFTGNIPLQSAKIKHYFDCIRAIDGRSAVDARLSEPPLVHPAELRGVVAADPLAGAGDIQLLAPHEALGFLVRDPSCLSEICWMYQRQQPAGSRVNARPCHP